MTLKTLLILSHFYHIQTTLKPVAYGKWYVVNCGMW
jgi:hypothetical protein